MSNLNPQASDMMLYTAYANSDRSVQISVPHTVEGVAKVILLDKIGYAVKEIDDEFFIVDADDHDFIESKLTSGNLHAALDEAFKVIDWTVCEPTELIGGSLGGGFGLEEQQ